MIMVMGLFILVRFAALQAEGRRCTHSVGGQEAPAATASAGAGSGLDPSFWGGGADAPFKNLQRTAQ